MSTEPEVRENAAEQQFELWIGGEQAGIIAYQVEDDVTLAFLHTGIEERFGHHGLGSTLIQQALDTLRARDQRVLPYCPFVKAFIQKHLEYADLVPADQRPAFGLPAPTDA